MYIKTAAVYICILIAMYIILMINNEMIYQKSRKTYFFIYYFFIFIRQVSVLTVDHHGIAEKIEGKEGAERKRDREREKKQQL